MNWRGTRHRAASFVIFQADFSAISTRELRRFGQVESVQSASEARSVLASRAWTGLVVDLRERGFVDQVGCHFRTSGTNRVSSRVRVLGLTDEVVAGEDARVPAFVDLVTGTPGRPEVLRQFAREAIAQQYLTQAAAACVGDVANQHGLTAMQTRILALGVGGVPRSDWPSLLGVALPTIKTHILRSCGKAHVNTLGELTAPVVRSLLAVC